MTAAVALVIAVLLAVSMLANVALILALGRIGKHIREIDARPENRRSPT